ncbi:MAG: hypothetical protein LUF92_03850 [Clostridiales bacterium]|nr:hypothetical protein [Clostridiales bacterium]
MNAALQTYSSINQKIQLNSIDFAHLFGTYVMNTRIHPDFAQYEDEKRWDYDEKDILESISDYSD